MSYFIFAVAQSTLDPKKPWGVYSKDQHDPEGEWHFLADFRRREDADDYAIDRVDEEEARCAEYEDDDEWSCPICGSVFCNGYCNVL